MTIFTPEMIASFLAFIKVLTTEMWPFLAVIFGLYIGLWIISGIFEAIWNRKRYGDLGRKEWRREHGQAEFQIDALRDDPEEMRDYETDYLDDLDDDL